MDPDAGPEVGYTGLLSWYGDDARRWRVWRLRDLVRLEDTSGEETLDARWSHDASVLVMVEPQAYWSEWLGSDPDLVRSTLRAVEHEGRPAWSFVAPEVKGGTPELTVDAELGLVVRTWREDVGVFREWTELQILPDLDPSFFRYDG